MANLPGTHVNMVDGGIVGQDLRAFSNSTITMTGGIVKVDLEARDAGHVTFSDGLVNDDVWAFENGILHMSGGMVNDELGAWENGTVYYSGGTVGSLLWVWDNGTMFIEGTNFKVNGVPLNYGDALSPLGTFVEDGAEDYITGIITGNLKNGQPLNKTFRILNTGFYQGSAEMYVIPEPVSCSLFALGSMILLRKNRVT